MEIFNQSITGSGQGDGPTIQIGKILGNLEIKSEKKESAPSFSRLQTDRHAPPRYPSPQVIADMFERLTRHHLLLLGGNRIVDKDDLARHLAWYTHQHLPPPPPDAAKARPNLHVTDDSSGGPTIDKDYPAAAGEHKTRGEWAVLEGQPSVKAVQMIGDIRRVTEPTIFVLPQLEPQDIKDGLVALQKTSDNGHHFVIISTDKPLTGWRLSADTCENIWYELPDKSLWLTDDLAQALITILGESLEVLPANLLPEIMEPQRSFKGKYTFQDVAEKLGTPTNIYALVTLLRAAKETVDEALLISLVEQARGEEQHLKQWFHTRLEPREQLLAVGICLFNGLYDNQFFGTLEWLLDGVWRPRLPNLAAFDYADLDNLGNLYKPFDPSTRSLSEYYRQTEVAAVETAHYEDRIELRSSDLRRSLLNIVWHSHRRLILATLPAMVTLAKQAAPNREILPTEIYGNPARRRLLQKVISETLSELMLVSPSDVEAALMQLAADEDSTVQAVVAAALAHWRDSGLDEALFDTLQRWQEDTRFRALISHIWDKDDVSRNQEALAYIRATVALTVSFAARYDATNQLAPQLIELLDNLAQDTEPIVSDRFFNQTLVSILPFHLQQLQNLLYNLADKRPNDFYWPVARALAAAYEIVPDQVMEVVDEWLRAGQTERPDEAANSNEVTQREALMAAAILTHGYIWHGHKFRGPMIRRTARIMQSILTEEQHWLVRGAVLAAILLQARQDFKAVEAVLPDLIEQMTGEEQKILIDEMIKIYLDQRQHLPDGERVVEINGRKYPVWVYSRRPLTEIEHTIEEWVQKTERPAAQKMGLRTSVAFVKELDQTEKERIDELKDQDEDEDEDEDEGDESKKKKARRQWRAKSLSKKIRYELHAFTASIITQGATYPIIISVLPEVLELDRRDKKAVRFVLNKWANLSEGEMTVVARRLKWTFVLSNILVWFVTILLASLVVGLITMR